MVGFLNIPAGVVVGIFGADALDEITDPFIGKGKHLPGARYTIEEFEKTGPW